MKSELTGTWDKARCLYSSQAKSPTAIEPMTSRTPDGCFIYPMNYENLPPVFKSITLTKTSTVLVLAVYRTPVANKHFNASLFPGGYSQKNWVGVCGPLPKTLTLFMTKNCNIPFPIYDLTKNSKPNL